MTISPEAEVGFFGGHRVDYYFCFAPDYFFCLHHSDRVLLDYTVLL